MAEETKETNGLNDLLGGKVAHFSDRSLRLLFQRPENVQGLVEIAAPDLAPRINFSGLERLSTSFIPRDLREREADILYRAPFQTADKTDEVIIHILMVIGLWLLAYGYWQEKEVSDALQICV